MTRTVNPENIVELTNTDGILIPTVRTTTSEVLVADSFRGDIPSVLSVLSGPVNEPMPINFPVPQAALEVMVNGWHIDSESQQALDSGAFHAYADGRTTDTPYSQSDIDLIMNKSELYHIDLYPEAPLDALQAISNIIHSSTSDITDGEVIDYIDTFLQTIGIEH